MNEPNEHDRLRAEEIADELAIRKQEQLMARQEREMKRELEQLEDAMVDTEQGAEREWRREHWGRDPERAPEWPNTARPRPRRARKD